MKIAIIGAGPTGLGAAWRLHQEGHEDWQLFEQSSKVGGLAGSVVDKAGYTWDVGGHVQFSHYKTFDDVMDQALGKEGWLQHERESWVRLGGTWVPYPFQYNIHRLPPEMLLECFQGLLRTDRNVPTNGFANFGELIDRIFGEGIARLFMRPYNYKVWAYPPEKLNASWIGERVALPDLERVAESIVLKRDNVSWGPNNTFRFPRWGGTGAIWRAVSDLLPDGHLHLNCGIERINPEAHTLLLSNGSTVPYDVLINSMALDQLVEISGLQVLQPTVEKLKYSSVHIIGVGLHGQPGPELGTKCWMYFPEDNCPFFRVTVFSHYSPNNVPDSSKFWSLMAEVSESPDKPVDASTLIEETIQGMINTGLIESADQVHHTYYLRVERGYPTPSLERDQAIRKLIPTLESYDIYSRGRFGAWRYEVSNQDHSFMQGYEVVGRLLHSAPELTLWYPGVVNATHPVYGKDWL